MKNVNKVTILGTLIAVCLLVSQCIMPGNYGSKRQQPSTAEVLQQRRAAIEAEVRRAWLIYETGDMNRTRIIINEVLVQDPSHSQALLCRGYLENATWCTIYPGDTLCDIASYYYEDSEKWSVLAKANGILDPSKIKVHQRLRVPFFPSMKEGKDELGRLQTRYFKGSRVVKIIAHSVKKDDSLRALARHHYQHERFRFMLADYNGLKSLGSLEVGALLKIPVIHKPKIVKKQDRNMLRRALVALNKKDYEKAYRYLNTISRKSPIWAEARRSLKRCRVEGRPYYEALGDRAFEASEARKACRYWKSALVLDPKNKELQGKLAEAKDLVKTLEMLPDLP